MGTPWREHALQNLPEVPGSPRHGLHPRTALLLSWLLFRAFFKRQRKCSSVVFAATRGTHLRVKAGQPVEVWTGFYARNLQKPNTPYCACFI